MNNLAVKGKKVGQNYSGNVSGPMNLYMSVKRDKNKIITLLSNN